jgi:hypothetical protein
VLPNERFSGKGHERHLCPGCSKLGAEELAFRQDVRNIDRLLDRGSGRIRRRDRSQFERFLRHRNDRVRRYAIEIDRCLRRETEEYHKALREDEEAAEATVGRLATNRRKSGPPGHSGPT